MNEIREFVLGIVQIAIGVAIGKSVADACFALLVQRIVGM